MIRHMASTPFSKIIDLVKKTGDTCIVLDATGEPSYVLLPFGVYERLAAGKADVAGMTEDQLLEKINRDIALWKSSNQEAENSAYWLLNATPIETEAKNTEKPLNKANFETGGRGENQQYYFEPID